MVEENDLLLGLMQGSFVRLVKDKHDLTLRQLAILLRCCTTSEAQTVRGLAMQLRINKPAITRGCDKLVGLGFLNRRKDLQDRRLVLITSSMKGSAYFRNFQKMLAGISEGLQLTVKTPPQRRRAAHGGSPKLSEARR